MLCDLKLLFLAVPVPVESGEEEEMGIQAWVSAQESVLEEDTLPNDQQYTMMVEYAADMFLLASHHGPNFLKFARKSKSTTII